MTDELQGRREIKELQKGLEELVNGGVTTLDKQDPRQAERIEMLHSLMLIGTKHTEIVTNGCREIAKAPKDKKGQKLKELVWRLEAKGIPAEHTLIYVNRLAYSLQNQQ